MSRPDWLKPLFDSGTGSAVGVAVERVDAGQIHAAVAYRDADAPVTLLHLAWHALLVHEPAHAVEHADYFWVHLNVDAIRLPSVIALCEHIALRSPSVFYALRFSATRFAKDGTLELGDGECGLTCATFVLAVFRSAGIDLVELGSWPAREDDDAWQQRIADRLEEYRNRHPERVTEEHIARVRAERGCLRYRPEEVAASASIFPPCADFTRTHSAAAQLTRAL